MSFTTLIITAILLNAVIQGVPSVYDTFPLHVPVFSLNFSQKILLVQGILITGIIVGSLTPHDFFARLPISKLLSVVAITIAGVAALNAFAVTPLTPLALYGFVAYLSGKINPKMSALIMSELPFRILAEASNFLSLLFTIAMPLGTAVFGSLATVSLRLSRLVIIACALASLFLFLVAKRKAI